MLSTPWGLPALTNQLKPHLAEEFLVHLPLPQRASHEYPAIAVAIDSPQLDVRLGLDGRSTRSSIDKRQLTEGTGIT